MTEIGLEHVIAARDAAQKRVVELEAEIERLREENKLLNEEIYEQVELHSGDETEIERLREGAERWRKLYEFYLLWKANGSNAPCWDDVDDMLHEIAEDAATNNEETT